MPATTPEAIALKRERDNARRRAARAADPKVTARESSERQRRRAARPGYRSEVERAAERAAAAAARAELKRLEQERRDQLPFVGCDGEGYRDADGNDRYALFRMGERELFNDGERLTTRELLAFIVAHPDPTELLVAFAFDYDVNNILRDIGEERWRRLLRLDESAHRLTINPWRRNGGWTWITYGGVTYGLQYIPRQFLKVCRSELFADPDRGLRRRAAAGSTRTIYDTFGFFQSSFLKAMELWEVGADYRAFVQTQKADRENFSGITPDIRRYCAIECELLAEMMERFRATCLAAGIRPRTWNGAGKIATALMKEHNCIKSGRHRKKSTREAQPTLEELTPAGLRQLAQEAYYGGRFEVTRCGQIDQPVHEHDINSAYPAAMLKLPCLVHGAWRRTAGAELVKALRRGELFVAPVKFQHPRDTFLCGLPIRSLKDGRLSWPRAGRGVYWSPEIRSAQRLGCSVEIFGGWLYQKRCECVPYQWIEELYEKRRAIGKSRKGIPFKLGYNSVYGKHAQRIGKPAYANPIYAGLITALTRATLNEAIAKAGPRNVVMLATDAIYTIGRRPQLVRGDRLGEWEHKRHRSLFIVRPGLYWGPKPRGQKWAIKSRGISPKFLLEVVPKLRDAWRLYRQRSERGLLGLVPPIVPVTVRMFCSTRLALHLKRPQDSCQWISRTNNLRFECSSLAKRGAQAWDGTAMLLHSLAGDPQLRSATYDEAGKLSADVSEHVEERMWSEAQPDPTEQVVDYDD